MRMWLVYTSASSLAQPSTVNRLLQPPTSNLSPDSDSLLRRSIHLVAGLRVERLMELGDVHDDRVRAVFARAVRVGEQALAQFVIAIFAGPSLRPADEEALIAREAVDDRRFLALQRQLVGAIGHREARQVGDVLAHREIAVDVQPGHRAQRGVLRAELLCATRELFVVFGRPPV